MKPLPITSVASLAVLYGLSFGTPGCSDSSSAQCTDSQCGPAEGATVDVADGGSDAPTDPCIENPTDPKCLDDRRALFVSGPNGNDQTGSGSRALLNNLTHPLI